MRRSEGRRTRHEELVFYIDVFIINSINYSSAKFFEFEANVYF